MKHSKLKISLILLFGIVQTGLQAQEALPASGGNSSGTGGTVSYTVGQSVYTTATGTGGEVIQGVQQPFEISVETGIEQTGINLECVIYPNPVTDYLILKIDDDYKELSYQLFDTKGQMITNGKVSVTETKIETDNLTQGNYLLRIVENDKAIKTFKIIKK
jgi:hypothetical protein